MTAHAAGGKRASGIQDASPRLDPAPFISGRCEPSAVYRYETEEGGEYAVARFEAGTLDTKKQFRLHRRGADGRWLSGLAGQQLPLWRSLELAEAISDGRTVVLVEGEKSVESLLNVGVEDDGRYFVTTNPEGAGSFREDHGLALSGAEVIMWRDRDAGGLNHLRLIQERAREHVTALRAVDVSRLPAEVNDAADYVDLPGVSLPDVMALLDGAGPVSGTEAEATNAPPDLENEWDASAMLSEPDEPPPDQLIERLIAYITVSVLFGPPSSAKSWALMCALVDLVRGGGSFMGIESAQVRSRKDRDERVLWMFGSEDNRRRLKRRIRKIASHGPHADHPLPPNAFRVHKIEVPLNTPRGLEVLRDRIVATGATVVVIDSVSSALDLEASKGDQVAPFLRELHRLRDELGVTINLLHHTRKLAADASRKPLSYADSMLGAQEWRALTDNVVMIQARDGDVSNIALRVFKAKDLEETLGPKFACFDKSTATFEEIDADGSQADSRTTSDTNLYEQLVQIRGWTTRELLAARVGCATKTIDRFLSRHRKELVGPVEEKLGREVAEADRPVGVRSNAKLIRARPGWREAGDQRTCVA